MARKVGTQGLIDSKTYIAEAANLQRGFCMIKGATEGGCNTSTVAGGACLGILSESTVNIGDGAPVVRFGDAIAIAGGAIAFGVYVKSDASGRVVPLTGATGEQTVGRAESIASAYGDEVVVFVGQVPSGSGGSGGSGPVYTGVGAISVAGSVISILPATDSQTGAMTAADHTALTATEALAAANQTTATTALTTATAAGTAAATAQTTANAAQTTATTASTAAAAAQTTAGSAATAATAAQALAAAALPKASFPVSANIARIVPVTQTHLGQKPTISGAVPAVLYTNANNITNETFWPAISSGTVVDTAHYSYSGCQPARASAAAPYSSAVTNLAFTDAAISPGVASLCTVFSTVDTANLQIHYISGSGPLRISIDNVVLGDFSQASAGGTAQAATSSTITLAAGSSAVNGNYNTQYLNILSGTGAGQQRVISGYVGSTLAATVSTPWVTTPDNTSVYGISSVATVLLASAGNTASVNGGLAVTPGAQNYLYLAFGSRAVRNIKLEIGGVFQGFGVDSSGTISATPLPTATRLFTVGDSYSQGFGTDFTYAQFFNAFPSVLGKYLGMESWILGGASTGVESTKGFNQGLTYYQRVAPDPNSWVVNTSGITAAGNFTLSQNGATTGAISTSASPATVLAALNTAFGVPAFTGNVTNGSGNVTGLSSTAGLAAGQFFSTSPLNSVYIVSVDTVNSALVMSQPYSGSTASGFSMTVTNYLVIGYPNVGYFVLNVGAPTSSAALTVALVSGSGAITATQWLGSLAPNIPKSASGANLPFILLIQNSINDDNFAASSGQFYADQLKLLNKLSSTYPQAQIFATSRPMYSGPITIPNPVTTGVVTAIAATTPGSGGLLPQYLPFVNNSTGAGEVNGSTTIAAPSGAAGVNSDVYVYRDGVHPTTLGHVRKATWLFSLMMPLLFPQ